ncbi:MAG: hypothetical protein AVDCRST_MAG13-952, partial [uncultured Solirubrobacteraceae bacterium]
CAPRLGPRAPPCSPTACGRWPPRGPRTIRSSSPPRWRTSPRPPSRGVTSC